MLILTDTDSLRVDLYKLCKRVLQTSCNGDCATDRNVILREFLSSYL